MKMIPRVRMVSAGWHECDSAAYDSFLAVAIYVRVCVVGSIGYSSQTS